MNNNKNVYPVSNDKTLSVRNQGDGRIAENNGYVPPAKEPPVKADDGKKKNNAATIIIIVAVVLVIVAALFFGYKLYMAKVSKDILQDLTGTWVYDTGSEDAGVILFMGNEMADIDGVSVTVTADKEKLVFEKGEEGKIAVEYVRTGEQIMLALAVENKLLESCNVTAASDSDLTGVLLYRISDSYALAEEDIQAAYYDRFPEYIPISFDDVLGDILSGDFDLGDISGYLPEVDSVDDLLDIYNQMNGGSYGDYLDDFLSGEFDASDFVQDYLAGLGEDLGEYIAGEIDGTETEEWIDSLYGLWDYYTGTTEEEPAGSSEGSTDDWGWGDFFGWGTESDESDSADSSDPSDWSWDWDW